MSAHHEKHTDHQMLSLLKRETFDYFLKFVNLDNGLIADKSEPNSPCSIAAMGMGFAVYCTAVEAGYITRAEARLRTLKALRFFDTSPQGQQKDSTGFKGFYYHFIDMKTGRRAGDCELSTVDTALFISGALVAAEFFDGQDSEEAEIRRLADRLYRRIDWQWATNGDSTITHGWKPELGFLPYRWDQGYSEALILYVLALGSPTFPVPPEGYKKWTRSFELKEFYGIKYIYAGPLFIHQMSHIWLCFRGMSDELNRELGFDYFENSRRATYVHRQYAIENPLGFAHYNENSWGITASDGPGPAKLEVGGVPREFYDYIARGAPLGPDDGTISPWAVVASLPFAPEIVLSTIRHAIEKLNLKSHRHSGFDASFNPTYPERDTNAHGWVSPWKFGINEGPILLMIENSQTQLIWKLMMKSQCIQNGLDRAGFRKTSTQ